MTLLDAMEQTAIGTWVCCSASGYYIMLAFHAIGLAMLVGSTIIIDLRLLGYIRGISLQALPRLLRFTWCGLAFNVPSGIALFMSEANKEFYSLSFRIKFSLVILGVVSIAVLNRAALKPITVTSDDLAPRNGARLHALISLSLWMAVIVVGRMNSYLTELNGN